MRDALTEAANGRREQRKPKAHVTLARPMRRATDLHREAGIAWGKSLSLGSISATLDRIALYTWDEKRHERLFRVVTERPLR
jgi:hypothetical protein